MSVGRRHIYVERGGFMLHLWVRREARRLLWGYALCVRDRYVAFGGRRHAQY